MSALLLFLLILAIVVGPFVLGTLFASWLRMPDYGWKIGVVLFSLVVGGVVIAFGWPPKRGIDLSGGVILDYQILDKNGLSKSLDTEDMNKLIRSLSLRVNPAGVAEITIRPRSGNSQVEIIIPEVGQEEAERIKNRITSAGTLEFRILANRRDHGAIIRLAEERANENEVNGDDGQLLARWVPVKSEKEQEFLKSADPEIAVRTRKFKGRDQTEVLVANDEFNVTGDYLTSAKSDFELGTLARAVNFRFNPDGASRFGKLTTANKPDPTTGFKRRLGIILDGKLYSAPSLNSPISDSGQITGGFTEAEADDLANVLTSGQLPATLSSAPASEFVVGATLGDTTIANSARAMLVACVLVPLFMIWYYRFSGLMAVFALVVNMVLLVAVMIAIHAAFTLAGLAGLALTVGMAVDNNVLIYERLREERQRGATLRMAIRNAFQRAAATIIDANLTTLIVAAVLYAIGSDQVKGFAVALGLGVALSMYTAIFVSRVVFDIAEKQKWITELKMLRLIGATSIDFMRIFPVCAGISVVVILIGLTATVLRGRNLLDIDFTGGVQVEVVLNKPMDDQAVRETLGTGPNQLEGVVVNSVQSQVANTRFLVSTANRDLADVERRLAGALGDDLARNSMQFQVVAIPAATPSGQEKPAEAKPNESGAAAATPERENAADSGAGKETPAQADATKEAAAKEDPATKAAVKENGGAGAEGKANDAAPSPAPSAEVATAGGPFAGGASARLVFGEPMQEEAVDALLASALAAPNAAVTTNYEISKTNGALDDASSAKEWTVKLDQPPAEAEKTFAKMNADLSSSPYFPSSTTIGSAVAIETQGKAFYALAFSWIAILVYLWVRFQGVAFGLAAVVALIHDVLVMLAAVALSYFLAMIPGVSKWLLIGQFKIDLPMVAAFLTIIGYSVNDTIIVFDRIRETRGKLPQVSRTMVNDSINQTLSRTLITSFTVLLVVAVLYAMGGEALRGFAFALIVGVVSGTYSSIYVAAPILLYFVSPKEGGKAAVAR